MGGSIKDLNDYLLLAWKETQKSIDLLQVVPTKESDKHALKTWEKKKRQPTIRVETEHNIRGIRPVLRRGQTNHILIYPGAFNPPHKGHIDMLRDGFHNSGSDLNIAAVIVAPTGDDKLREKERGRNGQGSPTKQVMLDQMQRALLLEGHLKRSNLTELACRTEVWTFPSLTPFKGYMQRVRQLARDDGYAVEFVSLKGPDHLCFDRSIIHPTYPDCSRIVFVETTSRRNEDVWENGQPKQLQGDWTEWSRARGVSRIDGRDGELWQSTLESSEDSWVRLLSNEIKNRQTEISSTGIRKLITEGPEDRDFASLVQELETVGALCPEMLLAFQTENTKTDDTQTEENLNGQTPDEQYPEVKHSQEEPSDWKSSERRYSQGKCSQWKYPHGRHFAAGETTDLLTLVSIAAT